MNALGFESPRPPTEESEGEEEGECEEGEGEEDEGEKGEEGERPVMRHLASASFV